jgi:hypothetical protein
MIEACLGRVADPTMSALLSTSVHPSVWLLASQGFDGPVAVSAWIVSVAKPKVLVFTKIWHGLPSRESRQQRACISLGVSSHNTPPTTELLASVALVVTTLIPQRDRTQSTRVTAHDSLMPRQRARRNTADRRLDKNCSHRETPEAVSARPVGTEDGLPGTSDAVSGSLSCFR